MKKVAVAVSVFVMAASLVGCSSDQGACAQKCDAKPAVAAKPGAAAPAAVDTKVACKKCNATPCKCAAAK